MRVIAFFPPETDVRAERDRLLQRAGVTKVACRGGDQWRQGQRPETDFDAVHAPGFPAIRASYSAAGIPDMDGNKTDAPVLTELESLPQSDEATIVCPGRFAVHELQQWATRGPVIVVNEAARFMPKADYFLANDGFILWMADIATDAVRVCRRAAMNTLPSCQWFALDRLGITNARFSSRCALIFATKALGAKHITLIGHDCEPGRGHGTGDWTDEHLELVRNSMVSDMVNLALEGVTIDHVRWDANKIRHEIYEPPASLPHQGRP